MNDSQILDQLSEEIDDVYPMSSIERLERSFCSNFSCCNILLPDLHALLDHQEYSDSELHLPPMATASTPKLTISPFSISYSPASSPPSSPSAHSTHSSISDASPEPYRNVCNAPLYPPTCPSPQSIPSPILGLGSTDSIVTFGSQPCIYQPDAYALSDYPTYEHCYDAAKRYLAGVPPSCSPEITVENPPSNNAPKLGFSMPISTTKRRGRPPSSASGVVLEHQRKRKGKGKIDVAGVVPKRRRSRKVYPCPNPGCSKSYLNPNGLKYHQEKGTCKIELPVELQTSVAVPLSTTTPTVTAPAITDPPKSPSPLSDLPMTPGEAPLCQLDCAPSLLVGHRYQHKDDIYYPHHRQPRVCNYELRVKREMDV